MTTVISSKTLAYSSAWATSLTNESCSLFISKPAKMPFTDTTSARRLPRASGNSSRITAVESLARSHWMSARRMSRSKIGAQAARLCLSCLVAAVFNEEPFQRGPLRLSSGAIPDVSKID